MESMGIVGLSPLDKLVELVDQHPRLSSVGGIPKSLRPQHDDSAVCMFEKEIEFPNVTLKGDSGPWH